jgi:DNA-binding response OmpR family regulator
MKTILIVEDDDLFAASLERALSRAGYNVVRAHNGVDALVLYEPGKVDVVLTDLIMPAQEGIELIRELRRRDENAKIIAMSGAAHGMAESYLEGAQRFGAVRTLAKPFSIDDLLAGIRECLDRPT